MAKYKVELLIRETFHIEVADASSEADALSQARQSFGTHEARGKGYPENARLINHSADGWCIDTSETIMGRISVLGFEEQITEIRRQAAIDRHFLFEPVVQKWIAANSGKIGRYAESLRVMAFHPPSNLERNS